MAEDWDDETGPQVLLADLRQKGPLTARKVRLWASACVRRVWHLLRDPASRSAVETTEAYVDGQATWREAFAASSAALGVWQALCEDGRTGAEMSAAEAAAAVAYGYREDPTEPHVVYAAESAAAAVAYSARRACPEEYDAALQAERAAQCDLLRCIFGDPSRPARIEAAWGSGAVVEKARAIYDKRRFEDLPVLGDLLEEAGCVDAEMLVHCRGPGPHARGCWVCDLLLAKE